MHEPRIPSLRRKDPVGEGMTTHSSTFAWRLPMDREAWWATVYGAAESWTGLKRLSTASGERASPCLKSSLFCSSVGF